MMTKLLYDNYQLEKLIKLLFSHFEHSSMRVFKKIHCDLWGLVLVLSIEFLPLFYQLKNSDIVHA
jgi:hypothetical protein